MADTTLAPIFNPTVPSARSGALRRVLGPDWQIGWLLVAPVHFNGITHGLKSMEGQTDRQYDIPQDRQVGS